MRCYDCPYYYLPYQLTDCQHGVCRREIEEKFQKEVEEEKKKRQEAARKAEQERKEKFEAIRKLAVTIMPYDTVSPGTVTTIVRAYEGEIESLNNYIEELEEDM